MAVSLSYENFLSIPNGTPIENHGYSQCVAVANLYSESVLGNGFVQVASAYQWWTLRYVNSILATRFTPQSYPVPGAIFVSLGGLYDAVHGHIGVVTAVYSDGTFDTMEQNTGPWYPQRYLYRYRRGMANMLGFLNPVNNPAQGEDELSAEDSARLANIEAILVGNGADIDNPAWLAGSGSVMGRIQNIAGMLYAGGTSAADPDYLGQPGTLYNLVKTPVHRTVDGVERMIPQIQDNADTNTMVRTMLAQIGALNAAVQALSVSTGADPEAIRAAAEQGAREALNDLKLVSVVDNGDNE